MMNMYRSTLEELWNADSIRVQAARAANAEHRCQEMEATIIYLTAQLRQKDEEIAMLRDRLSPPELCVEERR